MVEWEWVWVSECVCGGGGYQSGDSGVPLVLRNLQRSTVVLRLEMDVRVCCKHSFVTLVCP